MHLSSLSTFCYILECYGVRFSIALASKKSNYGQKKKVLKFSLFRIYGSEPVVKKLIRAVPFKVLSNKECTLNVISPSAPNYRLTELSVLIGLTCNDFILFSIHNGPTTDLNNIRKIMQLKNWFIDHYWVYSLTLDKR